MDKFTIADEEFLPYGKSESMGGDNSNVAPSCFEWERADPQEARFVTDRNIKHARGEGQIAWLSESFFLHPENYFDAMKKPFDAVLTHNRYFADNLGWTWVPHGGSWIDFNLWGMQPKTKNISLILSDKNSMPGHKLRHEVAEKFGDQIDDIFGIPERTRKFDCLAPYRYSIVIEAERCPGFFGEKLIDCLSVGTIPIYWGDPEIKNHFWHGIVEVKSFSEIADAISRVSNDSYSADKHFIKSCMEIAKHYRCSEDWIYRHHPELFGVQS